MEKILETQQSSSEVISISENMKDFYERIELDRLLESNLVLIQFSQIICKRCNHFPYVGYKMGQDIFCSKCINPMSKEEEYEKLILFKGKEHQLFLRCLDCKQNYSYINIKQHFFCKYPIEKGKNDNFDEKLIRIDPRYIINFDEPDLYKLNLKLLCKECNYLPLRPKFILNELEYNYCDICVIKNQYQVQNIFEKEEMSLYIESKFLIKCFSCEQMMKIPDYKDHYLHCKKQEINNFYNLIQNLEDSTKIQNLAKKIQIFEEKILKSQKYKKAFSDLKIYSKNEIYIKKILIYLKADLNKFFNIKKKQLVINLESLGFFENGFLGILNHFQIEKLWIKLNDFKGKNYELENFFLKLWKFSDVKYLKLSLNSQLKDNNQKYLFDLLENFPKLIFLTIENSDNNLSVIYLSQLGVVLSSLKFLRSFKLDLSKNEISLIDFLDFFQNLKNITCIRNLKLNISFLKGYQYKKDSFIKIFQNLKSIQKFQLTCDLPQKICHFLLDEVQFSKKKIYMLD